MKWNFFIIIITFCYSCQPSEPSVDTQLAPHQIEMDEIHFTSEELMELEKAKGVKTSKFTQTIFEEQTASENTYLYNISKITGIKCLEQTKKLEQMQNTFENSFELVHLFLLKSTASEEDLNFYIRKNNLAAAAFILSDVSFLEKKSNWKGQLPAVWMMNEREGINIMYEQELSKEELLTILQIVTL